MPLVPQVMKRSAATGTSDSTMMATAPDASTVLSGTDCRCRGPSVNRCEMTLPDSVRSAIATCAVSVALILSTATDVSK